MIRAAVIALVLIAGGAAPARAQEPGRFGLAMGYPASIGVIWHVSNAVAIRPEIALTRTSANTTAVYTTSAPTGPVTTQTTITASDQWSAGFGASALLYLMRSDALRPYVSPRFIYTRASSDTSVAVPSGSTAATGVTSNTYSVSGSIGAQYALGSRFGVYGEVGLGYARTISDSTVAVANATQSTFGTRSAVGVILYLGR